MNLKKEEQLEYSAITFINWRININNMSEQEQEPEWHNYRMHFNNGDSHVFRARSNGEINGEAVGRAKAYVENHNERVRWEHNMGRREDKGQLRMISLARLTYDTSTAEFSQEVSLEDGSLCREPTPTGRVLEKDCLLKQLEAEACCNEASS